MGSIVTLTLEVHHVRDHRLDRPVSTDADGTSAYGMNVSLTVFELSMAAQVGCRRQIESLIKGLAPAYGASAEGAWSIHIEGAAGEMAVAKAFGIYWDGSVNTFARSDLVGKRRLQVRTRSKSNYDLIVRDKDESDDIYILVTGIAPSFEIRGWLFGDQAKKEEWKQTYGNRAAAYFVPAASLNPIRDLRELL